MCFSLWARFLFPSRRALTAWWVCTVKLVTMATWRSAVKSSSISATSTKQVPSTSWWGAAGTWPLQTRGSTEPTRKQEKNSLELCWGVPSTSTLTGTRAWGPSLGNSQDPAATSRILLMDGFGFHVGRAFSVCFLGQYVPVPGRKKKVI